MGQFPRLAAFLLVAVLLVTTGCSFGFIYRQLDWLVPWYVTDYVTLDDKQHSALEKRLEALLEWHCSTQLQRYATWFRKLEATPNAFDRKKLEAHYKTTHLFWRDLMGEVSQDATVILETASDEQINELVTNLKNTRRESEQEYKALSEEKRAKRRIERMSRLLERWIGGLQPVQQGRIEEWSAGLGSNGDTAWLDKRRRWQEAFFSALSYRNEKDRFSRKLHQLLVEPETLWSMHHREVYFQRKSITLDMLADVAASMNEEQLSHLKYELLRWADKFESLACTAESPENATAASN